MSSKAIPILLALAALAAPPAAADSLDELQAPTWDDASYDAATRTLTLAWHAPGNDVTTPYTYHIYHNGDLVTSTTETQATHHIEGNVNAFYVVAEADSEQSPPSLPLVVQSSHTNEGGFRWESLFASGIQAVVVTDSCQPVGTIIEPGVPPSVFIVIQEECIPIIGSALSWPLDRDMIWWR